jgi:hypothetical protein
MSDNSVPSSDEPAMTPTEGSASDDVDSTRRRRLLATGAASWATVALAGCPGGDEATPTAAPTDTDTAAPTATATEAPTPTATEEPTDTPTETATPEAQPENYVVTTETWAGGGVPAAVSFMASCARTNAFVPGMEVVFFVGVYDPETGDLMGSDSLSGVSVNVGDMGTVDLSWSDEHGHATRNEGNSWVGSWTVPEDMDPGGLNYTVEVSNDDANFHNVGVLTDAIDVVEYDDPSNLVVDTETRWNGHPAPEYTNGFVGACAPEREFTAEMDVTFVIGIYDSTSGNMVGTDGVVNPNSGEAVEDGGSEFGDGLDSVTVVSPDDAFEDLALTWTAALDDENGLPRWFGTLETEGLDPGSYAYEVQISDESDGQIDVGIATDQFSIIEMPADSGS